MLNILSIKLVIFFYPQKKINVVFLIKKNKNSLAVQVSKVTTLYFKGSNSRSFSSYNRLNKHERKIEKRKWVGFGATTTTTTTTILNAISLQVPMNGAPPEKS
jgi:hypothetical protein